MEIKITVSEKGHEFLRNFAESTPLVAGVLGYKKGEFATAVGLSRPTLISMASQPGAASVETCLAVMRLIRNYAKSTEAKKAQIVFIQMTLGMESLTYDSFFDALEAYD